MGFVLKMTITGAQLENGGRERVGPVHLEKKRLNGLIKPESLTFKFVST